jgi:hypothetical protein
MLQLVTPLRSCVGYRPHSCMQQLQHLNPPMLLIFNYQLLTLLSHAALAAAAVTVRVLV